MTPLDGAVALDLLRTMWRIRIFESRVGQLKRADEVYGLIHLSEGQEAVAAGVCAQLRDDDAVYSGHRAHGHAIAKGAPLDRVMAELMGREDGLCQRPRRIDAPGGHGARVHGRNRGGRRQHPDRAGERPGGPASTAATSATVVFFGDGAVQAGHFNETINLATLWGLPLILVCENNGFAEFTPRSAHTKVERVSDVVAPYELTSRDRRRQRPGRGLGGVRRASSPRPARARARCCSSA